MSCVNKKGRARKARVRLGKKLTIAQGRLPELRERLNEQLADPSLMANPAVREALESASRKLDRIAQESN